MKPRVFPIIRNAILLAATTASLLAVKVTFDQLPAAAQQAIRAKAGVVPLDDIDQMTVNGKTVYEVAFKLDGRHTELRVTADGTLLDDQGNPLAAGAEAQPGLAPAGQTQVSTVTLAQAPAPVQQSVRALAGQRAGDIRLRPAALYEVTYVGSGGKNETVRVAGDGRVIEDKRAERPVPAATLTLQNASKVELNQVPEVVQRTLRAYAREAQVEDVDRGMIQGRPVYQAAFKRNNQHTELQVTEDGFVLNGSPAERLNPSFYKREKVVPSAVPAAVTRALERLPGFQLIVAADQVTLPGYLVNVQGGSPLEVLVDGSVVSGGTAVAQANATPPGQTVISGKLKFDQLPPVVRDAVVARIGPAEVNDIDREVRNGQVMYEIGYKVAGTQHELRVSDKGQILGDTAARAEIRPPAAANQSTVVQLRDVPPQVQQTVTTAVGTAPIAGISKAATTIYTASFLKDGKKTDITLLDDGSLVIPQEGTGASFETPLGSAVKVKFDQLPAPVQETVKARAGDALIEDIDKGSVAGATVYQAAFKRNGKHVELRILESGSLAGLRETPMVLSASPQKKEKIQFAVLPVVVQNALLTTSGSAEIQDLNRETTSLYVVRLNQGTEVRVLENGALARSSGGQQAKSSLLVPLADVRPIDFAELPLPVQRTLRVQAGNAAIREVSMGTWSGRVVYQASINKGGVLMPVQIGQDGTPLSVAAGATTQPQP